MEKIHLMKILNEKVCRNFNTHAPHAHIFRDCFLRENPDLS